MIDVNKSEWIGQLKKFDHDIEGFENFGERWKPIDEVPNYQYRTILKNELVFDIDSKETNGIKDFSSANKLAANLENVLTALKMPFIRCFSGNLFHYHLFINPPPTPLRKLQIDIKQLRNAVFEYIISELVNAVPLAWFDVEVMNSTRHAIREIGGKHPKTGYYKTILNKLPAEQPKTTKGDVTYPNEIKLWEVPEQLVYYLWKNYIKKPVIATVASVPLTNAGNINWIEKLLQTPISDGRHRAIGIILAPYLMNIKRVDETTAMQLIINWLRKCNELYPTSVSSSLIRYWLYYYRRRNYKPLSIENVSKHFGDVQEILEVISNV